MKSFPLTMVAAAALAVGIGSAQIERLDLPAMVGKTDNAVYAEIVGKRAFRVDHPVDGPELYFTTLTLQGRSLRDGTALTVDVTFPGGFVSETEGVHNSEAPSAEDTKVGNRIVAFYKWNPQMGGGVRGNSLYASHGGLFRTVESPKGTMVLGRGEGYAIDKNLALAELDTAVRTIIGKK